MNLGNIKYDILAVKFYVAPEKLIIGIQRGKFQVESLLKLGGLPRLLGYPVTSVLKVIIGS